MLVILVELNVINLHTFKMVTKIQQFCMHCNVFFSTGLLCAAAKDEKSPRQDSVLSLIEIYGVTSKRITLFGHYIVYFVLAMRYYFKCSRCFQLGKS